MIFTIPFLGENSLFLDIPIFGFPRGFNPGKFPATSGADLPIASDAGYGDLDGQTVKGVSPFVP